MDSAECKVGILLGIALPKMNGDTHSTLLMVSWRLMIFLFWKNSGVFLLIQTLCQPGFLQRFHSHILAPALPVLVNHSRCQQSQSKCRKDNYLVDDTTLCPLTVINFSCISTRLVAEAHEIQFANTEHLNTEKIFLSIAMKYLLLAVMQECFKTCISLSVHCSRGLREGITMMCQKS